MPSLFVVTKGDHHQLGCVTDRDAGDRDAEVLLAELLGLIGVIGELPERELAGFGHEAGHAGLGTGGGDNRAGHDDRGAGPVAGLAVLADDQAGSWIAEQPVPVRPGPAGPLGQGQALPEPADRRQGAAAGNRLELGSSQAVQAGPNQPVAGGSGESSITSIA